MTAPRPFLPLLLLLSGCIFVPTPQHGHLAGHGEIGEEEAAWIVPGRANREAILSQFGEPDASLLADRLFVYLWTKIGGYMISEESGPTPRRNAFLVLFDDRGYVVRTGRWDSGLLGDALGPDRMTGVARAAEAWAVGGR